MNTADSTQAGVRMQWDVKIPLRDGVQLNATLYKPDRQAARAPAIFTLTPYVAQRYHEEAWFFASHGYPFLTVDVRGRGDSDGVFVPFVNDGRDGADTVEWLAQQPYCNGQVAMWGGSYGGYCQWMTATQCPPHLASVVPVASPFVGVDFPMRNNILAAYSMQWLTFVSGRASQDKIKDDQPLWRAKFRLWFEAGIPFKELDTLVGKPSALFQEWLQHPQLDAYWDTHNPTPAQYARVSLPIMTVTGAYDADQPGALAHYREHMRNASAAARARHYLVIGPWNHGGMRTPVAEFAGLRVGRESLIDFRRLHLQWYAWTMQEGPKPELLKKRVAYYVMGAERWRYADALKEVTANTKTLYLSSAGDACSVFHSNVMGPNVGSGEPDVYVYDPRDIRVAASEGQERDPLCLRPTFFTDNVTDQKALYANEGAQLIFHSAPFEADIEVSGFFKLRLWLSIDRPDTDFGVGIYEIDNDGGSILLTCDSMRARHRTGLREQRLITNHEGLQYNFERFTFISREIRKGHRLRLVIGPVNSIHYQKNYNSGGIISEESMHDGRPVTVKLFHDETCPSALYVPIGRAEE